MHALLVVVACAQAPAPATPLAPLTRVATIELPKVEGRIDHLALDPARHRVWVAALENDTVEVVDVEHSRHERTITGTPRPSGVAFAPELDVVLVAGGAQGTLDVFDAQSCERKSSVAIGADADNVRWDDLHHRAIVAYGGGALALVDASAWKVATRIELGNHPEAFELDEKREHAFVNVPDSRAVVEVELASGKVVRTWKLSALASNYALSLDPARQRLHVACRTPSLLVTFALDDARDSPCGIAAAIATDVDDVCRDTALDRVYLSSGVGFVDVLESPRPARPCSADQPNFTSKGRIATSPGARTSLFDASSRRFYLAVPHRGEQRAAIWVYEAPQSR